MDRWTAKDSEELYGVRNWGSGYFSASAEGNLLVHPDKSSSTLDLKALLTDLQARGIETPVLLRFPQILQHRLREIDSAFKHAANEFDFQGSYAGIFPIKVNQQSHVVSEYLQFAREFGYGIEAGSKPELLAVLAAVQDCETPIVCNGFKDDEFIETVILACKLGLNIIPIVEKYTELEMILRYSEKHKVRPRFGVRVKLASRGAGRWEGSAGVRSKFGLTVPEVIRMLEFLKELNMADCLQLLHFHMGSQVTNIRHLKAALTEAGRIYANLYKAGAGMKYLDVGGGLAVDYDGSQTSFASSMNYTLQEYANDVIFRAVTICNEMDVPHPVILSESGRAMISYHSMLVFNVLGRSSFDDMIFPISHFRETESEDTPTPLRWLRDIASNPTERRVLEDYHDGMQFREEAIALFNSGSLSLEGRAEAESLFWRICQQTRKFFPKLKNVPPELEKIDEVLADTYYCNFSVFQSMPDSWAIEQLFPVMPIHRLTEKPERRGMLADITCDSDGKIDRFAGEREIKRTLELHETNGEPYYLGVFLIGAYQEILGDLHNLLGDTNAVHVTLDEAGEAQLDHIVEGDTVSEVLTYVQFDPRDMIKAFRSHLERAVKERRITAQESGRINRFYTDAMNGYTYLEEPTQPPGLQAKAEIAAAE